MPTEKGIASHATHLRRKKEERITLGLLLHRLQIYYLVPDQKEFNLRSVFMFHQEKYYLAKMRGQRYSSNCQIEDEC